MPKKGGNYTTMTDDVRIALCNHKKRNPTLSQVELQRWLKSEHNIDVSQPTINMFRNHQMVQKSINDFFQLV
jgi:hypothetical protein